MTTTSRQRTLGETEKPKQGNKWTQEYQIVEQAKQNKVIE